jgi:AcrR family transcriptional regulator
MAEKTSTRERILEAAIAGIEKYGIDQLTTRKIAEEAGANIASINYYFRTKGDLVAQVLETTAEHMLSDVRSALEEGKGPSREIMHEVFLYLIEGMMRYPGVTTAHLYRAIVDKEYESPGASALRHVFKETYDRLHRELPEQDPERLRMLLSVLFGAMMFTGLAPKFFQPQGQFERLDSDGCQRLADLYTDLLFRML